MKASLGIVNLKELGDKRAKKAAIILWQVIATAVPVAIAAWRLGHLLGIEPQLLDTMLALGLPLIAISSRGSFDHLVGEREQRRRHSQAERPGGLEVDGQLILGRCLHRKVGRFQCQKQTSAPHL